MESAAGESDRQLLDEKELIKGPADRLEMLTKIEKQLLLLDEHNKPHSRRSMRFKDILFSYEYLAGSLDRSFSELHRKCCLFSSSKFGSGFKSFEVCPCCCRICQPIDPKEFKVNHVTTQLLLVLVSIWMLGFLYLCSGLVIIYSTARANWGNQQMSLIEKFISVNNLGKETYFTPLINILFPAAFLFAAPLYLGIQYISNEKLYEKNSPDTQVKPSDFAVLIEGVKADQEDIEQFVFSILKQRMKLSSTQTGKVHIENIITLKRSGELEALEEEMSRVRNEIQSLNLYLKKEQDDDIREKFYEERIARLHKKEKQLIKEAKHKKKQQENASSSEQMSVIVVFSTISQARLVERVSKRDYLLSKLFPCLSRNSLYLIKPAPDPDDIRWKYVNKSYGAKVASVLLSNGFFLIAAAASLGFQLATKYYYLSWTATAQEAIETPWIRKAVLLLLPLMSPTVVVIFNSLTVSLVSYITEKERHVSGSEVAVSNLLKMIGLQFFHAVGFPFCLWYLSKRGLFEGLIDKTGQTFKNMDFIRSHIFWMLLVNAFVTPLLSHVDIATRVKIYLKKRKLASAASKKKQWDFSAKELNEIFEPAPFPMSVTVANMIRSSFVAAFYIDLAPSGMLFTMLYILLQIQVDNRKIHRLYSLPREWSRDDKLRVFRLTGYSIPLFVLGHVLLKYRRIIDAVWEYGVEVFLFDCAFVLLAFGTIIYINSLSFKFKDLIVDQKKPSPQSLQQSPLLSDHTGGSKNEVIYKDEAFDDGNEPKYSERYLSFTHDYSRENPVTSRAAIKNFHREIVNYGSRSVLHYAALADQKPVSADDTILSDFFQRHTSKVNPRIILSAEPALPSMGDPDIHHLYPMLKKFKSKTHLKVWLYLNMIDEQISLMMSSNRLRDDSMGNGTSISLENSMDVSLPAGSNAWNTEKYVKLNEREYHLVKKLMNLKLSLIGWYQNCLSDSPKYLK